MIRDRRGALLTGAVINGGIWAAIQALLTMTIGEPRASPLACTSDLPSDELALAAWMSVIAAFIAFGAAAARWRRLAVAALVVELGCVIALIAIGGFGALDCALGV